MQRFEAQRQFDANRHEWNQPVIRHLWQAIVQIYGQSPFALLAWFRLTYEPTHQSGTDGRASNLDWRLFWPTDFCHDLQLIAVQPIFARSQNEALLGMAMQMAILCRMQIRGQWESPLQLGMIDEMCPVIKELCDEMKSAIEDTNQVLTVRQRFEAIANRHPNSPQGILFEEIARYATPWREPVYQEASDSFHLRLIDLEAIRKALDDMAIRTNEPRVHHASKAWAKFMRSFLAGSKLPNAIFAAWMHQKKIGMLKMDRDKLGAAVQPQRQRQLDHHTLPHHALVQEKASLVSELERVKRALVQVEEKLRSGGHELSGEKEPETMESGQEKEKKTPRRVGKRTRAESMERLVKRLRETAL